MPSTNTVYTLKIPILSHIIGGIALIWITAMFTTSIDEKQPLSLMVAEARKQFATYIYIELWATAFHRSQSVREWCSKVV